ncbi:hypothetical protein B0I08_10416 [Glaciihabitans tibetensis]|uniref:Uncharacterized protein n=2 Tax=Glaciihabitans tibetensis TaxID=1266600 RepID=A0A2T0VDQ9_9MICO|nr:hypothetical protein B0I08_10416 [Glaciihabitans tibetensis]
MALGTSMVLAATLAGCTPSTREGEPTRDKPSPSEPPQVEPTESTPAESTPAEVTSITMKANGITLLSSDDSSVTYDYFSSVEPLVAALSGGFGYDPEIIRHEPDVEPAKSTEYAWGGFSVHDADGDGIAPFYENFRVATTTRAVESAAGTTVTIGAGDGIEVGRSAPELAAAYPDTAQNVAAPGEPERLVTSVDVTPLPTEGENDRGLYTFSVGLTADDPNDAITRMIAPSPNFGS